MRSKLIFAAPLFALALLTGCAKDLVVVIPDSSDGHIGAVVVESGGSKTLLDTAYASATPSGGTVKAGTSNAQDVNQIFGSAIAARPMAPKSFTLYFKADSDELLPDSRAAFEDVFAEVGRRKAAEIVVTGHTDTMGQRDYNDKLSLERAKAISKLFVSRGLAPAAVIAAGRGERELLVQTPDETPEPRNRRVEITVR